MESIEENCVGLVTVNPENSQGIIQSSKPSTHEGLVLVAELPPKILKQHKRKILKNLAVLSIAWLFLFTGYNAIQNLQSSLNKDDGLGTVSISVDYGATVVSCMFVPPLLIDAIGYKWTLVVALSCFLPYNAANFYASWYTFIPTYIVLGFGAAPLGAANAAYLTKIGKKYGHLSKETDSAVITRFFGIFFMVFQLTQVTGNAITSTVLSHESIVHVIDDDILAQCGADYCHDVSNNTNLRRPDDNQSYVSCALGINMVGFVMICYGISDSIFSLISGKVVQYIGRPACFWTGAVIHFSVQVALLLWRPHPSQLPVFFVIAALWGMCDAIWQSLLNAYYGCVVAKDNRDAAFSNCMMWKSVGFIIAFAYSSFICTKIKLYILLCVLAVGMTGYTIIEVRECKRGEDSIKKCQLKKESGTRQAAHRRLYLKGALMSYPYVSGFLGHSTDARQYKRNTHGTRQAAIYATGMLFYMRVKSTQMNSHT